MKPQIEPVNGLNGKSAETDPLPSVQQLLTPPFVSSRWIVGGHLQSIMSLRANGLRRLRPTLRWVDLPDGDRLAMQDDLPTKWCPGDASLLLVHGLCGSSESAYMLRLAARFTEQGVRVFRLNLRGCGAGQGAARQITHAGRHADVAAALAAIADLTHEGPLSAAGISLGGNQLLLAFGIAGSNAGGQVLQAAWYQRIRRIAAISPPIDLARCSDNMERRVMRPYNRFFIRYLLQRIPDALRTCHVMMDARRNFPKTLRQFDDRVTAPLAGYRDALSYYQDTASQQVLQHLRVPALILAASDDPIVPVSCFGQAGKASWPDSIRLVITRSGGHAGFVGRGNQRHWMDGLLERWFEFGNDATG